MITKNSKVKLSETARMHIETWIKRYPANQKRSGVMEALRFVQEENGGSLTVGLMDAVADILEMPNIAVYEVATFYSMYHEHPVGRHVLELCTNLSCQLNGADELAEYVKKRLGIDWNETTPDNRVTLKHVECLGACINAPVCMLGKKYIENLTPAKVDELLGELK